MSFAALSAGPVDPAARSFGAPAVAPPLGPRLTGADVVPPRLELGDPCCSQPALSASVPATARAAIMIRFICRLLVTDSPPDEIRHPLE